MIATIETDVKHNPHIPCELQGGHDWQKVATKDVLENRISLLVCVKCGKVNSGGTREV